MIGLATRLPRGPARRPVPSARGQRGKPLVGLLGLLVAWIAARAMVWDAAMFAPALPPAPVMEAAAPQHVALPRAKADPEPETASTAPAEQATPLSARAAPWPSRPPGAPPLAMRPAPPISVRAISGHQLLWLAALGEIPLPEALVAQSLAARRAPAGAGPTEPASLVPAARSGAPALAGVPAAGASRRWSADGWLLLRRGGAPLVAGAAAPTYGASQAGAVLRYRLAPASALRPAAYLRATAALAGGAPERAHDREAAAGILLRPLAELPLAAMAELRVSRRGGGVRVRPAAMIVTELAPVEPLPGLRAEAYGQAGYVGGTDATAFADGQVRFDTAIVRRGTAELRAGAGAWGGAQRGAARLDIGPAATLGLALGEHVSARIAVDWRVRVAGDAAPASGPAITLSAGF